MFVSMRSRPDFKLGHVESKTRSLGQILEKPYKHSRGGGSFDLIIMTIFAACLSICNVGHTFETRPC